MTTANDAQRDTPPVSPLRRNDAPPVSPRHTSCVAESVNRPISDLPQSHVPARQTRHQVPNDRQVGIALPARRLLPLRLPVGPSLGSRRTSPHRQPPARQHNPTTQLTCDLVARHRAARQLLDWSRFQRASPTENPMTATTSWAWLSGRLAFRRESAAAARAKAATPVDDHDDDQHPAPSITPARHGRRRDRTDGRAEGATGGLLRTASLSHQGPPPPRPRFSLTRMPCPRTRHP